MKTQNIKVQEIPYRKLREAANTATTDTPRALDLEQAYQDGFRDGRNEDRFMVLVVGLIFGAGAMGLWWLLLT